MNLGIVAKSTFFAVQDSYCLDPIKEFWQENRSAIIDRLHAKDHVVAIGHCAQYCTYTTMDYESRDIINITTVDKRETNRNSVAMEKEGFTRTMDQLLSEIPLKEMCTDAHVQIKRGRYGDRGVIHTLDMWHGAKSLAKKLHAAGQVKGQTEILPWLKDIVNHFWFCCKEAQNMERFMVCTLKLFLSIYIKLMIGPRHNYSPAYMALVGVVLNKKWLKDVPKFLNFRTTSDLETFHNHILMYAGKRFAFSPPVYEARTLLAALDYNHHNSRPPMLTKEGNRVYVILCYSVFFLCKYYLYDMRCLFCCCFPLRYQKIYNKKFQAEEFQMCCPTNAVLWALLAALLLHFSWHFLTFLTCAPPWLSTCSSSRRLSWISGGEDVKQDTWEACG
uniref:Uncharacterized protein n=1 Tax=Salarias fasciatus TaxID=181472 RepID=A0A672JA34_SALFA